MLVVSRNRKEVIVIGSMEHDIVIPAGNPIRIILVEPRHDRARIGVEAVKSIPVHRLEVFQTISKGLYLDQK